MADEKCFSATAMSQSRYLMGSVTLRCISGRKEETINWRRCLWEKAKVNQGLKLEKLNSLGKLGGDKADGLRFNW